MSSQSESPRVWVIRAGRDGEDEDTALEDGLVIVRFWEFDDLSRYASSDELVERYLEKNPSAPRRRAESYARQLWTLRDKVRLADIVVLPLKKRSGQIAIGRVTGPYRHAVVHGELRHTRPVEWTRPDLPRSTFQQDLLYSFGGFSTIFRVQRNDAERRVEAVLAGKPDPGPPSSSSLATHPDDEVEIEGSLLPNLEQAASDEITAFVRARFPDHDMARLVEAVLQAEGFKTLRSPPGPDGGADILAGRGPLGLDAPYLCVQVKATGTQSDVKILRELGGTMATFKASQGLLVSWSGFTQAAAREARQETFKIRLWDQSHLVQAIYQSYDKLPAEIQAELPLKRVWMLVHEGDEEE